MPLKQNQALTPEKKQILVDEIQQELSLVTTAIKEKRYNEPAYLLLQQSKDRLQNTLNKILEKKGIITPNETTKALQDIDEAKRARLEKDFIFGLRKGTFFILAIGIISVAAFMIVKNKKK